MIELTDGRATPGSGVFLASACAAVFFLAGCGSGTRLTSANNAPAPPVTVTVSPTTASLQTGQSTQFSAKVTGATNTAVTWSATSGTIASDGTYTAGANAGSATVTATSVADPTKSASAAVTIAAKPQPISVVISPTVANVQTGQSVTFTAKVANSSNQAVTWTATGGSVVSGVFTAGNTAGTGSVTATSVADPTKSATAALNISLQVQISVTPVSPSVPAGAKEQFTATVSNTANASVTWAATGGTISQTGLFTAGNTPGTGSVTATSVADTTKSATTTVIITAPIQVSITPSTASVLTGGTVQFSANVPVTWSATGGTIDQSGLFTAGATAGTGTVTATSIADTTKSATVSVAIKSASGQLTISPTNPVAVIGQTLKLTATSGGLPASGVTWITSGGTIASDGTLSVGINPATLTVTATDSSGNSASTNVTVTPALNPSAASWLYSAPVQNLGPPSNISSTTSSLGFYVNTYDGGWNYQVQYTDGTHGTTTFNDLSQWRNDTVTVDNPANGYHPSTGSDGHLIVVNTITRTYYDFWALNVDSNGNPTSTHVGQIVKGSLDTSNGTPGTTAAQISGWAGDILPGELDCDTCLNHALNVVVPATMDRPGKGTQAPINGYDGSISGGIFQEGAKIQFDPSIDVSTLSVSTPVKAIMRALQLYGGLITDQTGGPGVSFYSALPTQPDLTGINLIGQHLLIYY